MKALGLLRGWRVAWLGLGLAVFLVIWVSVERQATNALRQENAALRDATRELFTLRAENDRLQGLQVQADELERLRRDNRELLKLRGEVAALRRQLSELRLAKTVDQTGSTRPISSHSWELGTFLSSEEWSNAGLGTPEHALQTLFFAMKSGDTNLLAQITMPGQIASDFTHAQLAKQVEVGRVTLAPTTGGEARDFSTIQGGKVVYKNVVSPREVQLNVEEKWPSGEQVQRVNSFRLDGSEWKYAPGLATRN